MEEVGVVAPGTASEELDQETLPVDLERDTLVHASVDLAAAPLRSALRWLVARVQEQQKQIAFHSTRLETLETAPAPSEDSPVGDESNPVSAERRSTPGGFRKKSTSDAPRGTIKEELLAMQILALKREVEGKPDLGDVLDKQREMMAASAAEISDRLRIADERLNAMLAEATRDLQERLVRITVELVDRVDSLDVRMQASEEVLAAAPLRQSSETGRRVETAASEEEATSLEARVASKAVEAAARRPSATDAEGVGPELKPEAGGGNALQAAAAQPEIADTRRPTALEPASAQAPAPDAQKPASAQAPPPDAQKPASAQAPAPEQPARPGEAPAALDMGQVEALMALMAEGRNTAEAGKAELANEVSVRTHLTKEFEQLREEVFKQAGQIKSLGKHVKAMEERKQADEAWVGGASPLASLGMGAIGEIEEEEEEEEDEAGGSSQGGRRASRGAAVSNEALDAIVMRVQVLEDAMREQPESRARSLPGASSRPDLGEDERSLGDEFADHEDLVGGERIEDVPADGEGQGGEAVVGEAVKGDGGDMPRESLSPAGSRVGTAGGSPSVFGEAAFSQITSGGSSKASRPSSSRAELDGFEPPATADSSRRGGGGLLGAMAANNRGSEKRRIGGDGCAGAAGAGDEKLAKRVDAVEAALAALGKKRSPLSGGQSVDAQQEMERFRKLFEFVEGVLPKEKADAMRFFQRGAVERANSGEDAAKVFGDDVEGELQRAKLQEEVRSRCDELRDEFEKIMHIVRAMQRDVEKQGGKHSDLANLVARVERDVSQGDRASAPRAQSSPPPADLSHLVGAEGLIVGEDALPFATKKALHSALATLKDDIQNWLGMLHQSMLSALQQKADTNQLDDVARQVSQAAGAAGDSVAAFARRALLGRCASCDTLINADPAKVSKHVPVGLGGGQWPPRANGAKDAIRLPESRAMLPNPAASATRLPRIADLREGHRQFPKGKVLRGAGGSSPELRAIKLDEYQE